MRLRNAEGRVAFGEIAPLPHFGSETVDEAIALCHSLSGQCDHDTIRGIPSSLPACQFGFESAWEQLTVADPKFEAGFLHPNHPSPSYCRLLPTGDAALYSWQPFYQMGDRTFKWKIGVTDMHQEVQWFQALMQHLPPDTHLRLDANGGLTWDTANRWLEACDRLLSSSLPHAQVEFLEQPLPPPQFDQLLTLRHQHSTPIALDESVATLTHLQDCYANGWRGIVVIKAAIAGSPLKLRTFCTPPTIDIVWSSVLETAIARTYLLNHLIPTIPSRNRALGFGVNQWFANTEMDDPSVNPDALFNGPEG